MREKIFKNEVSENISQKFHDQWKTQLIGTSCKIDWDDLVDEFDSRHDNRRIKLHWGDDNVKF